jgi:GGDEF domain-containing protein
MSDDPRPPTGSAEQGAEPSVDAIDAVVRSIAAKEGPTPAAPPEPIVPLVRRPIVVPSAPPRARRPAVTSGGLDRPVVERRAMRRDSRNTARQPPRAPRSTGHIDGLMARLEWERLVADEAERQRRYGRPSSIVLIEIDGLDGAIERAGPGVVGRLARPCAETLVTIARASDRLTRLADGRFGILLRETDADGASRYATRAVAACDPWLASMPWPLRLAISWASPDGDEDLVEAFHRAERQLATGRD